MLVADASNRRRASAQLRLYQTTVELNLLVVLALHDLKQCNRKAITRLAF